MIAQIQDNFFTEEECFDLINFFKQNKELQEPFRDTMKIIIEGDGVELKEKDKFKSLFTKINNNFLKYNAKVDWAEIVEWPPNSFQALHQDFANDKTIFSSITYLNNDYVGGQTFFEEGTVFKPKKRRMLFFDGWYYKHGVSLVQNGTRYTLAAWYKSV